MGKKEHVLVSRPLPKVSERLTDFLTGTEKAARRRHQFHLCGLAEACQAAADRAQACENQIRAGEPCIDNAVGQSKFQGQQACNQACRSPALQCDYEALYNEVCDQEPVPCFHDFIDDKARAQYLLKSHTEKPLGYNECSEAPVADQNNDVLTNRGGAEPQPTWIGKLFGLGIAYDRYQQRVRRRVIKKVNIIRNPSGAVLALIREFSAYMIRARHNKDDRTAWFNNPLCVQHITEHVTERGGAGSKSLSQRLKRDGRLRVGLRRHRQALSNHLDRVQRWLSGNRGSGPVRLRESNPNGTGNTPAATVAATPRSAESLSTGPFPPYEDPVDGSEHPSPRSSYISHKQQPRQRGLALDEGEDTDVAPNQPGPSRMSSRSPGELSDTDPEAQDVRFSHIDWTLGLLVNNKTKSSPSESVHISSLDSQDLRSIRRIWSRDHWELYPADFRPMNGDLSRSRTFDSSWLASNRGRIWMEAQKAEPIFEAELVGDSTEESSSSHTGRSAKAGLYIHKNRAVGGSSPSSYHFLSHTMPRIQKLAFRVARPEGDVQGTRTLSFNSWFDDVQIRRMGSWYISRSDNLEGSNDTFGCHKSRSRSESPRPPSGDIYNATPPRQSSPERVVATEQTDQPGPSSVPAEVNDLDNQVLKSVHELFRPSVEHMFSPLRTMGFSLPELAFNLPRRPSTVDSSEPHSPSTITSSRFPSIGSEITPATTADGPSQTEGDSEVGDASSSNKGSESKGAALDEDDGQTKNVDLD